MDKPRFCHVAGTRLEHLLTAPLLVSGYYNWHRVFDAPFLVVDDIVGRTHKWDIIFIAMTKNDMENCVVSRLRQEIDAAGSQTQLIVCVDYAVEIWQNSFHVIQLRNELRAAHKLFAPDPISRSAIRALLHDDRPVHLVTHPTHIPSLRAATVDIDNREREIVTLIHYYDANWLYPWMATDGMPYPNHVIFNKKDISNQLAQRFRSVQIGRPFHEWIRFIASKWIAVDGYHHIHSIGRLAIDNACIGVPTVGASSTYGQSILWPTCTVESGDMQGQREIVRRLFADRKFYDEAVAYASEKIELFSYDAARQNMIEIWKADQNETIDVHRDAEIPVLSQSAG